MKSTAKLFENGRSQAVRLPKAFRFKGTEVKIRRIYPFDEIAAQHYATIRSQLEKSGRPICERDTHIAAIARANALVVVTHNTKEFTRIARLKVEDWAV